MKKVVLVRLGNFKLVRESAVLATLKEVKHMKKRGKRLWLAVLVLAGMFSLAPKVSAESSEAYQRNYESNGEIGFYGTYIYPEKDEPTIDVPSNSQEVAPQAHMSKGNSEKNHDVTGSPAVGVTKIPQTGDKSPFESWVYSLLFMTGAFMFWSKYKTKQSKEELV